MCQKQAFCPSPSATVATCLESPPPPPLITTKSCFSSWFPSNGNQPESGKASKATSNCHSGSQLSQNLFHHSTCHIRQSKIPSRVGISQPRVIQPE